MDKLTQYRQYVQQLLKKYASYRPATDEIEVETIFDTEHDHYQVVYVGWEDDQRIHGCSMHVDLKNGKIWIQHNGTEASLANELVEMGVPKTDIVIGLISPPRRPWTEFAVC